MGCLSITDISIPNIEFETIEQHKETMTSTILFSQCKS